jgi:hypothetical protein
VRRLSVLPDSALALADRVLARVYALQRYFLVGCVSLALILALQLIRHSHLFPGDDYIHLGTLDGVIQDYGSSPFQLYQFYDGSTERWQRQIENGPLPWFADPKLKFRFFRPLSSGLLALDYALFGHRTWGYRIDATLWFVLLVVAYGLWVRRIIPPAPNDRPQSSNSGRSWHPAAMLALLIFVVADNHWLDILWSAGRWVLVSTALTVLGCVFYERWRSDAWRPGLYLSVLTIIGGFLSGEVALAILAFPLASELFSPEGGRAARLKGLALLFILAIGYLVFYKVGGYGTHGSNVYLNPMEEPATYLARLPTRILAMSGELLLWTQASLEDVRAGIAGVALFAVILAPAFRSGSAVSRSRLAALLTGTAGSMLPLASGDPNTRNLMVPLIGVAAMVGIGIHAWWSVLHTRTWQRWVAVPVLFVTTAIHLGISPYRWFTRPAGFERRAASFKEIVRSANLIDARIPGQRAVFLTGVLGAFFPEYFLRRLEGPALPECWWLLSTANAEHVYHRTAPNRLELELVGRELLSGDGGAFRSLSTPIHKGDRVHLNGLEVDILEVGKVGARRVGFTFDRNLDDPSLVFMAGPLIALKKVVPPAIGETLRLPSAN